MIQQDHLQIFDLTLTVRSPLFIGDGRMYTKAEYLYCTRNGRASLLDEQKFFTFLTDRGLIDRYIQFMLCNQSNLRDFLTEDCGVSDADLNALTRYTSISCICAFRRTAASLPMRSTVYSGGFRSPTVRPSRMSRWLFAENSMYFRTVPFQRTVRKAFPCSGNARFPALRFILS